jgi:glycosyltransferase involved in cell wall biosynthesis
MFIYGKSVIFLKLFREWRQFKVRHSAVHAPHIVVGITSPQTCLLLGGRLRALREAGFRVTLVASPGEMLDHIGKSEGVETVGIPMVRRMAPVADFVSLVRLWFLLMRIRPDVVEFSTPKAGLLGMLAAVLAGVPRRIYILRGLKLESASGVRRRILLAAERMASVCAQTVVCVSPSLRMKAFDLGLAPADKLQMLGSGSSKGVDIEHFHPGKSDVRKRFGVPTNANVVGFVGRLTRDKGIPALIEAFDRILLFMPHSYLLLVGWFDEADDALDSRIRERITRHPRIVCTGFVVDTAPYYGAMDLFVLPTLREGFPNVVLEASASGIPVITTLSTGACDSVVGGETGILVPGDPGSLSEAIVKLLREPDKRVRMGSAGRAWVLEHFTDQRLFGLTTSFYKSLLRPGAAIIPREEPAMDLAVRSQ